MSNLRILAPAPHARLATLAAVKVRLGISSDDESRDADLLGLLDSCSAAVSAAAPHLSLRQFYAEQFYPAPAHPILPLGRYPFEPDTLTLTEGGFGSSYPYQVEDARVGLLRRACSPVNLNATYWAGYVAPENLKLWSLGLAVARPDFVRVPGLPGLFEVLQDGDLGEAPTSATVGEEVESGSAIIAAREVEVVPPQVQSLVVDLVAGQYQRQSLALPAGTSSLRGGDFSATFEPSGGDLGAEVCRVLKEVAV